MKVTTRSKATGSMNKNHVDLPGNICFHLEADKDKDLKEKEEKSPL
jgi:hypothetical protein